MKIQALLLSFVFISSIFYKSDIALATDQFSSKEACFQQFRITTTSTDLVAAENFCKNKFTKSAADLCADQKLLDFKMKNSISSADEPKYAIKFKNECLQAAAATSVPASATASANTLTAQQIAQQNQFAINQAKLEAERQAAIAASQQKKNEGQQGKSGSGGGGGPDIGGLIKAAAPLINQAGGALENFGGKVSTEVDKAIKAVDENLSKASITTPFGGNVSQSTDQAVTAADRSALAAKGGSTAQERSAAMVADEKARSGGGGSDSDASSATAAPSSSPQAASSTTFRDPDSGAIYEKTDIGNGESAVTRTDPQTGEMQVVDRMPANAEPVTTPTPAETARDQSVASQGDAATPQVEKSAETFKEGHGDAAPAADGVTDATNSTKPTIDGGKTEGITKAGDAKSGEAKAEINSTISQVSSTLKMHVQASMEPFNGTVADLEAFKAKFESFSSKTKPECLKLAESANKLCKEKTSPGAQAAKNLAEKGGKAVASSGSAQKACSGTANLMDLIGKGMQAATGVCAKSKMSCDSGCAAAQAEVKQMLADLKKIESSTITSDEQAANQMCEGECGLHCAPAYVDGKAAGEICEEACTGACQGNVQQSKKQAEAAVKKLTATVTKESTPSPDGTVAATQAKCAAHTVDIASFLGNIADFAKSEASAADCDKKLSAAGAAGAGTTPQQYCEQSANSGTQFCKCQKDNSQQGCPGFLAKPTFADKAKSDVAGTNIKGSGGLSGFASSARPGAEPSKNDLAGGDLNGLNGSDGGSLNGGSLGSRPGAAGAGGSSDGGSFSMKNGSGSDGSDSDKKSEKKKWSFGSLANGLSNLLTGKGGSSSRNSKKSGNGDAKAKQQDERIKRKLASDKIAAEITSASGKSNWEKIHKVYTIKENTLMSER